MILGFSTGCLHETQDRLSPATFDIFRKMGANAIELMVHDLDAAHRLLALVPEDLMFFEYISIHAPGFDVFNIEEITKFREALAIFEKVAKKIKIDTVVVHADMIRDGEMFFMYDLPIKIENMDWHKEVGKYTESMQAVFEKLDAPMVLNLNHCYTNDPTMHLAKEMTDTFGGRIEEIHLSGFEQGHEPLFKTKQLEIMQAIPDKRLPIIIESECDTIEDAQKEFEYVKKYLLEN
ncbi:MAG: hypothetical protein HGA36_05180 [Candidatus Moranbacteria bacterium]|nr:hypothetical protein [Candidatus Moranbacteria bacterium]